MISLVILSSFMRYIVAAPFEFTEEVVGLLFLTTAFASLPALTLNDRHIDVSILYSKLSKNWQYALKLFSQVTLLIFSAWFAYVTWEDMIFSAEIGSKTETSALLLYPWMIIMPLVLVIISLICLYKIILLLLIYKSNSGTIEVNRS